MNKYKVFLILITSILFLPMLYNMALTQSYAQNQTWGAAQNQTASIPMEKTPPYFDSKVFGNLTAARNAIQENDIFDAYRALNTLEQQLLNHEASFDILNLVNKARQALQYDNNYAAYRALNTLEQQLLDFNEERVSQIGGSGKSRICDTFEC